MSGPNGEHTDAGVAAMLDGALPDLEAVAARDPGFVAAYRDFAAAAWTGPHLALKDKHLVCLAVNASATHLHQPGVDRHIRGALRAGAGEAEILDVLETASVIGVHAATVGFPILMEELAAAAGNGEPLNAEQARAKQAFVAARGGWNPRFEPLARLAPGFLQAYAAFSSYPQAAGPLSPVMREFVYIAIDAAATHLFEPGIRGHIRAALALGATAGQISELLQLVSLIGIEACLCGLPALAAASAQPPSPSQDT